MPQSDVELVATTWAGLLYVATTPKPASYFSGRKGYNPAFLGENAKVDLPEFSDQILDEEISRLNDGTFELKYHHFSTAQCATRRVPFYSACNINGTSLISLPRHDIWSYDGRIPTKHQMLKESYGPQQDKKFSRGHMTRRQDPNWDTMAIAKQANIDTFFATNACPQWQPFNDGIWGDLEDYILHNAGNDRKLICVFTGPFLYDNDPDRHNVQIPCDFWKVVAFISEATQELAAIGYVMSQREYLATGVAADLENFEMSQRPLSYIEQESRLSFTELREADVLAGADLAFVQPIRKVSDTALPQKQ